MEVITRPTEKSKLGDYGLIFRRRVPDGTNAFDNRAYMKITPDGKFTLFAYSEGNERSNSVNYALDLAAIAPAESNNHLAVTCQGRDVTVEINGKFMDTYHIPKLLDAGQVGVDVWRDNGAEEMSVLFRSFRVTPLP